jgi:hypothetical protein
MTETRIKISSIVENQLPQFVKEEFPLVSEFLTQYYTSLENQGGTSDLLQNIDQYIKVDNLTNLIDSTTLSSDVTFFDSTINVNSTAGFPDSYGLLLIDSEIITYTSKTSTTFDGCVRGFNGITSYGSKDELTFTESESEEHTSGTVVDNLSILFLKEFLVKIKNQFTPGFESRELYSELNESLFIKQSIDFYSSKGTDNSFKILFSALYGKNVEVIRPRDYLIQPSDAQYRITSDLVVQSIEGDPNNLVNETLYQDQTDFINQAQGTITKVEKIRRGDDDYYIISLDSDYDKDIVAEGTIYGKFTVHPNTKTVFNVLSGSETIEVDSTVSFPNKNGNLIIDLENGTSLNITYESKTLNQFLGCSGITQDIPDNIVVKTDSYAYGTFGQEKIKVRILSVLSELRIPENTSFYSKGDLIKIKTLGENSKDYKSNNWFFNVPVTYEVKSVELLDSSDRSYKINTYDDHSLRIGDSVSLLSSTGEEKITLVSFSNSLKSFNVQFGSDQPLLNLDLNYLARKNLLKVSSQNYPLVNQYTSNVQNVYLEDEDSLYVASPSLPSYFNNSLKINDQSIIVQFNGTYLPDDENDLDKGTTINIGSHGFYTGDLISYIPSENNNLGISTGFYFIKRISETEIKLSRSRVNIFNNIFLSLNGSVANASAIIEFKRFTDNDYSVKSLEPQKLIRKLSEPQYDGNIYETQSGSTGIFINGVEILNYKSKDNVYYGPIEEIIQTSSGSNYDVINPPILSITDPIGFGASAYCSVIGELNRINIIDPGFDYLEDPKIEIFGGNGFNASAKANLISFDHTTNFNSQGYAGLVKLNPINSIRFSDYHKFRDFEEVIYLTNGQTAVAGLSTNSSYFVSVQDEFTVKLHKSISDAVSGINTIQLTSYGVGNHTFKSKNKKKKIGSITVENVGEGYQNKLTKTTSSGINTASNIITIKNHGYLNGEIITYSNSSGNLIGGLSNGLSYYVTKVNDNEFKLSQIGIGTVGFTSSFYFDTKQHINLISTGSGIHEFNYPQIRVTVSGKIGISTLSNQNFNAVVQPVFRGKIQSVFVESGGDKYGSEDILNYNRQPLFELNSGSGAQITPIVSNGQIVDVLVNSPGSNYNSPPDIEVIGDGNGAILTPILSNGSLSEIKIISGGIGYNSNNTSIIVNAAGSGAKFECQTKVWKINLVDKLIRNNKISEDDGILVNSLNTDYGLQYTHAYAPRQLRSIVQGTRFEDGEKFFASDLQVLDGTEITSNYHSPIIGWAYDGNPIYGPYGYSSKTGGSVKCLTSGYKQNIKSNRPGGANELLYPFGFFIDDYEYYGDGDLDEHNGRFGITPEYPNGIYAYFTTINDGSPERSGLFDRYKKPIFPYVIGSSYKAKPIEFNFDVKSNQDFIDINQTNWKRNTTSYNLTNKKSSYEYLLNPNSIKENVSNIRSTSTGVVESIEIISGGENYKVGDKVLFKNKDKFISGAKAKVSLVKGKSVSNVSVATSSFDDVVLVSNSQELIGFTTVPHNYKNNDLVTFTGTFDYKKSGNIAVNTNNLSLRAGVGSAQYTGLVTYFNVSGNLNYPNIKENDIYEIGSEQVKVLYIDIESSRIRVLRNQNNTVGLVTYSSGTNLTEKTKRFSIYFGISTSYNFNLNREFYFVPKESIGLGTVSGVGIVSTIYFSSPGVGATQITIPTQTIYLPNHNLVTGDSLIYSSNGGTPISISNDGLSSFQLSDNSTVYAAKFSNDLIGISTVKVGLGSTGIFVGIGSTSGKILYFTSGGAGSNHSFRTNYQNILRGNVSKNVVTVSTTENHELSLLDEIILNTNPGFSTTFVIKYNDFNRRVVINPRAFSSINTENNTIRIINHRYFTGQKVVYTSNTPASGLTNEEMYYVTVVDPNTIMLSNSYYGATKQDPDIVIINSSTAGTISPINPPIQFIKNQQVIFDLSDPSLSFTQLGVLYPAFDFKLYKDSKFTQEFEKTEYSSIFEVSKTGLVGIDSTAKVTININENLPNFLYYKLIPVNLNINTQIKKDIITDTDVISSNKISLVENDYNGRYTIVGVSLTSFEFNILEKPRFDSLSPNTSKIEYYTNSTSVVGEIKEISLTDKGKGYYSLPSITSVKSDLGSGSILIPVSNSIGRVLKTEIQDIGFNYPADNSIRPTVKYPDILSLESLSSFDYIGITSFGVGYNIAPSLIVIDGLTNSPINDVDLKYSIGDNQVTINKNSFEINNVTPKIIPINNSNGIKINNIVFNSTNKNVVVTLGASFSDPKDFPFSIGSKVLIEGVSVNVGVATTGKGYNSSVYNYSLFTLTGVTTALGGSGANVTYNLSSYLNEDEIPGTFNSFNSSGRIIPESHFPVFNPVLKKNVFYKGEDVYSASATGKVENWDEDNQYLKISTIDDFEIGQKIIAKSSGSVGIINKITTIKSDYKTDSSSLVKKGWNRETGFLNNSFQRIHDNDYYQYFSYALKSEKDFNTWDNPVSTLNHTSGFKKFSDLIILSEPITISGISTDQNQGDFFAFSDLSSVVSLNCEYDFDLAKENNLVIDGLVQSDEIQFNSTVIQDYIESIGNRVLVIDDVSEQFNSNPRPTAFSVVDTFLLNDHRSKKYITLIRDKRNENQSQITMLGMIHDNNSAFLSQYGINVENDLGFFDFNVFGTEGNLIFYPLKTKINDYHVQLFSFSLNDTISGIGTVLSLGDSTNISVGSTTIPQGTSTSTSIVGIASTYRSAKVLVQIGATDSSYFEYDEINYVFDGTNVNLIDYGQVTTDKISSKSSLGIGTYDASLSGSNISINLIPNNSTTIDYVVNTLSISIGSTFSSGIGTQIISGSLLNSSSVGIASSSSPIANIISSYSNLSYNSSYSIVSVEDKTNSEYQMSELLTLSTTSDVYTVEFGTIETNSSIGVITAGISGSNTVIYFTPNQDIDVDVKVFNVNIGLNDEKGDILGYLNYDYNSYTGTDNDIKKEFNITHKNLPIFQRNFNGSDPNTVIIESNIIKIPNHFYSTGEEVIYSYPLTGTSQPIGIATTTIPGIGTTDKLPSSLYIVKVNDLEVQVSASASDALKTIPSVLTLTSIGTGNVHTFTCKNQNEKVLVSIDNLIQSPVVSTSITTIVSQNATVFDSEIYVSDPSSIFSGDLVKIDDEIMRVNSVGVGSTNSLSVIRPWLGTKVSVHTTSSLVNKIYGNYNIVDNRICFAEAPFGKVPFPNPSNRPDEFDYIGIATGSSFGGRVFLRSGSPNSLNEIYDKNYIFDDISDQFNGSEETFTLKLQGNNVSGISTDNAIVLVNNIFQSPISAGVTGGYDLSENSGISSITFIGNKKSVDYDINTASIPRGGIIVSVGSTQGFGYQPLVSAGGTAIVSIAGTIQSISIGNSGSGYRSGIQTVINVGVKTENLESSTIKLIGTATVNNGNIVSVAVTNPGFGYTSTNPPIVVFDAPLSYSNIPLIYSSNYPSGVGTGAVIDIVVGQGSSIISFELKNLGYGYERSEVLTVAIGGTTGIQTTSSPNFSEFQIIVDNIHNDQFSAWTVGSLQVIDPLDSLFDGKRTIFPILISGNQTTIKSKVGSNLDVQASLLVFINDVLQIPGKGYVFTGGSTIQFTEAPKVGDVSKIIFYKGTGEVDTKSVDILETVKVGDTILLNSDNIFLKQDDRIVTEIVSSDIVNTNLYFGPGVSQDENLLRPLTWCKQTDDLIINGKFVGKDRVLYEPYVQPSSNIIRNVGINTNIIFVESVRTFFDSESEYTHDGTTEKPQNKIIIISQDTIISAEATANVSTSGTISSITITDGGIGYSTNPSISISNPIGIGSTGSAMAITNIINGSVTSVAITSEGFGYDPNQPPMVLIESPQIKFEVIDNVSYQGDFGVITGIKTTSVGVASTGIVFDFFILQGSPLRNNKIVTVGSATTGISGIQTGYYFAINRSNIGNGVTSLDSDGNIVGVGTTFIDNIYQVASVSIAQTAVSGVGITYVAQVTVSISDYNNLSGFGFSSFYGEYSWGRIYTPTRLDPQEFNTYANIGGISSSPLVQRFNRLKYSNYNT